MPEDLNYKVKDLVATIEIPPSTMRYALKQIYSLPDLGQDVEYVFRNGPRKLINGVNRITIVSPYGFELTKENFEKYLLKAIRRVVNINTWIPPIPATPLEPSTPPDIPLTPLEPSEPVPEPEPPMEPLTPAEPFVPMEPLTPAEPVEPLTPLEPSKAPPMEPLTPAEPAPEPEGEPWTPLEPAIPVDPEPPVDPEGEVETPDPVDPPEGETEEV